MIAATAEGEMLLVEQTRIPMQGKVIELPAGLVADSGIEETPEQAATRELEEETGYRPASMTLVCAGPPTPGLASEIVSFCLAEGLTKIHEGGGLASEDITVHRVPLDEVEDWMAKQIANGIHVDPKVYIGLYFLNQHRQPK